MLSKNLCICVTRNNITTYIVTKKKKKIFQQNIKKLSQPHWSQSCCAGYGPDAGQQNRSRTSQYLISSDRDNEFEWMNKSFDYWRSADPKHNIIFIFYIESIEFVSHEKIWWGTEFGRREWKAIGRGGGGGRRHWQWRLLISLAILTAFVRAAISWWIRLQHLVFKIGFFGCG